MNYFNSFMKSLFGKVISTFILLHSVQWLSTSLNNYWCHDPSITGYFRGMIKGHSPFCYTLTTISYQAQASIYKLVGLSAVTSTISQISEFIFRTKKSEKQE